MIKQFCLSRILVLLCLTLAALISQTSTADAQAVNLTGQWSCDDGGRYYMRQIGSEVWWFGQSNDGGRRFTNVFYGRITGKEIRGRWADVPIGSLRNYGSLRIRIDSPYRLTRISGNWGGSTWTRAGGPPSGAGPPSGGATTTLQNGGAGPSFDGNRYRGKFFASSPAGTITELCVYARRAGTSVTVGVRRVPASSDVFREIIAISRANAWNCKKVSRSWSARTLFIYKVSGNASIGFDRIRPYDSQYSRNGSVWFADGVRRGYRVSISSAGSGGGESTGADNGTVVGRYRRYQETAIVGYNKKSLRNVSVQDCMRECDRLTWCTSFEYIKTSNRCNLHEASRQPSPYRNYDLYVKLSGSSGGGGVSRGGGICDDPQTLNIIDAWLARANPIENQRRGYNVRYEAWGRLVGRTPSASLTITGPPDTRMTRCEWLWYYSRSLRSTNLGTLRDYVERRRR